MRRRSLLHALLGARHLDPAAGGVHPERLVLALALQRQHRDLAAVVGGEDEVGRVAGGAAGIGQRPLVDQHQILPPQLREVPHQDSCPRSRRRSPRSRRVPAPASPIQLAYPWLPMVGASRRGSRVGRLVCFAADPRVKYTLATLAATRSNSQQLAATRSKVLLTPLLRMRIITLSGALQGLDMAMCPARHHPSFAPTFAAYSPPTRY